ncbi:unnamed protein product, partial [Ixodes pacificus]
EPSASSYERYVPDNISFCNGNMSSKCYVSRRIFFPPGEPPDYTDVTKVTFHTNPEPQVSEGAQQRGNAAVAVKTGVLSQCHFTARCHSECWNHLCVQSLKIRRKSTLRRFLRGQ